MDLNIDIFRSVTGFVGPKLYIQKNIVGKDVFLFHHCSFGNYLTSLINSVSTIINSDTKLPLEESMRNIVINYE